MKYGKKTINNLSEKEKDILLQEIIDRCVRDSGDSYEDFASPVVKLLVHKKLAEYGE